MTYRFFDTWFASFGAEIDSLVFAISSDNTQFKLGRDLTHFDSLSFCHPLLLKS